MEEQTDKELIPSSFDEFEKELEMTPASKGKRFGNYVIDRLCGYVFAISVFAIIALIFPAFADYLSSISRIEDVLLTSLLTLIYYVAIESGTGGRSIGKLITKTKVVNDDGGKPDFATFIKRNLCRYIPFEPFSFLGGAEGGWHDSVSHTRVVNIR